MPTSRGEPAAELRRRGIGLVYGGRGVGLMVTIADAMLAGAATSSG